MMIKDYLYKSYSRLLVTAFAVCSCSSCDFLDQSPEYYLTPDGVFIDNTWAEQCLNTAYLFVPEGFNRIGSSFLAAATDDGVYCTEENAINKLGRGLVSSADPVESYWADGLAGIRSTLYFEKHIPKLENIPAKTPAEVAQRRREMTGESAGLRGLFYFELLKRYGGMPIITDVIEIGDPLVTSIKRATFEETVEHIVALCDSAYDRLPETLPLGRMTKGAALAIKAKCLAYAASDLYEGQVNPLLGYGGGQIERQKKAAKALAAVINFGVAQSGEKTYQLFNNYAKICTDITAANRELIFIKGAAKSNSLEKNLYPPTKKGNGGTFPTQEFVNAFEMVDGSIPATPYTYTGRDPRFGMSVLYDGATLGERGVIYTHLGDLGTEDGYAKVVNKSTTTGYYLRKFLYTVVNFDNETAGNTERVFPVIRLADILLLYAEMMNAAYGPDQDPEGYGMTALAAINSVRGRAGVSMPLLTTTDRQELQRQIINERRVELSFEDQRYFDLRRWKLAEEALSKPVHGMKITWSDSKSHDEITVDNLRKFTSNMYFSPVPYTEILINTNLEQNPGW